MDMVIDLNLWPKTSLILAFVGCLGGIGGALAGEDAQIAVRPGDTLISLSQRYLDRPERWVALKSLNHVPDEFHLQPGSMIRLPAQWLRWTKGRAEVLHVTGKVTSDQGMVAKGMKLPEGDHIDTGSDGFLTLKLRNGATVVFPPGTRARLGELKQISGAPMERTVIDLEAGSAESHVPSLKASDSRFEVRTPRVVTAVRGTRFRVGSEGEESHHELIEGKVWIAGKRTQATLNPGEGVVAEAGRVGKPVALPPAPDVSELPKRVERTVVSFSVPPLAGVAKWHWRLAADADFTLPLKDERTSSPTWVMAGVPDGDYFLALRTVDAHGLEGRDAVRPIAVRAHPEPPLMLYPSPEGFSAGKAHFTWAEAEGAATTRLQMASDPNFERILVDVPAVAARELTLSDPVSPGDYWWRLASRRADGYQGPFGDGAHFHQLAPTEVAPPSLSKDGLHVAWSGPQDLRYRVQLGDDVNFSAPPREIEVTGTSAQFPTPKSGLHFLRIQPVLADGSAGPWSTPQRFEVPSNLPWWALVLVLPLL